MKAVTHHHYGSPNVLTVQDVETPEIGDHDLLVEVHASAVTQGDRRMRAADFPGFSWLLGRLVSGLFRPKHKVPGSVFAGRITAVGSAVTRFTVGDDVFGITMHGAQAEYVCVGDGETVARMPQGLDYSQAAALPYGAMTALMFLDDFGQVKAGQRVAVVGAAGGVGLYAVQIAKALGAEVTAVCGPESIELVRGLGADHVIDYQAEDFTRNGQRYDVILDTPDGTSFQRCRGSLTAKGRYLTLALGLRVLFQMAWTKLRGGQRAIFGVSFGTPAHMDRLRDLVEEGALVPVVDREFSLGHIAQAHTHLEARTADGTVVLTVESHQTTHPDPNALSSLKAVATLSLGH